MLSLIELIVRETGPLLVMPTLKVKLPPGRNKVKVTVPVGIAAGRAAPNTVAVSLMGLPWFALVACVVIADVPRATVMVDEPEPVPTEPSTLEVPWAKPT